MIHGQGSRQAHRMHDDEACEGGCTWVEEDLCTSRPAAPGPGRAEAGGVMASAKPSPLGRSRHWLVQRVSTLEVENEELNRLIDRADARTREKFPDWRGIRIEFAVVPEDVRRLAVRLDRDEKVS